MEKEYDILMIEHKQNGEVLNNRVKRICKKKWKLENGYV